MNAYLNMLLTPLAGFVLFGVVAYGLYRLGDLVAPKLKDVGGKLAQYACGEDVPAQKFQLSYKLFFYAALFFTMMHVAALVIATIPAGIPVLAIAGLCYLAMIVLSITALVLR
jgi:NADH:ubiquinone oxidoreductase subunit 3 (subunit A)